MLKAFGVVLIVLASIGCQAELPKRTVRGPETSTLLDRVDGALVYQGTQGAIEAWTTGNRDRPSIVLPLPDPKLLDKPTIHAISGPDNQGRIAYIEDHFFVPNGAIQRHALKAVQLDGAGDAEYFSRPGNAMWAATPAGKGEIGKYLALAPRGGNVALLSNLEPRQMPAALLHQGTLEIWNLDTRAGRSNSVQALNQAFAWFPDGKRLVYSSLVPRRTIPERTPGLDTFEKYLGQTWDELPCLHILDVETGKSEFFCVGWQAVVAADGETVYVGGWGNEGSAWERVSVADKSTKRLELPGRCGPVVGVTRNGLLVYWGWPTAANGVESTRNNSPLSGPKQVLTIKVADPQTAEFATILPHLDPRNQASFGGSGRIGTGG